MPMIRIRRLAALLLALACAGCVPPAATAGGEAATGASADAAAGVRLLNREEALRAMDLFYDPLLRDAGVTGLVLVDVTLNADGTVGESRVASSTHERFSVSAEYAARTLRFNPPATAGATARVRMEFRYRQGAIAVVRR